MPLPLAESLSSMHILWRRFLQDRQVPVIPSQHVLQPSERIRLLLQDSKYACQAAVV